MYKIHSPFAPLTFILAYITISGRLSSGKVTHTKHSVFQELRLHKAFTIFTPVATKIGEQNSIGTYICSKEGRN